jgi:hypothetical protein
MFGAVQQSSMCNHVSSWVILHSEQFMLGKSSFQKRCFWAFPIYWPYLTPKGLNVRTADKPVLVCVA